VHLRGQYSNIADLWLLLEALRNEGILPWHKHGDPCLTCFFGQSSIKSAYCVSSGGGEHKISRVVNREIVGEADRLLDKHSAAYDQKAEAEKIGDGIGEMPASESLICEESLSQRVGDFEEAKIGCPQLHPQLRIEQGSNVVMGRSRSQVFNENARIDNDGGLSDPDPP
jgi:hypothetical protein